MAGKNELTIVAKLRDLASKGFSRLERRVFKAAGSIINRMSKVTAAVGAAGLAFATFKGVSKFFEVAKEMDKLAKNAKRLRITTEELSSLSHAAQLSGSSFDSLSKGIRNLERMAVEAARGNKIYARSFQDLGVKYEDLASGSITVTEALAQVADGLNSIDSQSLRVQASMNLFGRAGTDLLPMLQGGSKALADMTREAKELGIAVDEGTTRKFEGFQDAMLRVGQAIKGFIIDLSQDFLPDLTKGLNAIVKMFAANRKDIINEFKRLLKRFMEFAPIFVDAIGIMATVAVAKMAKIIVPIQALTLAVLKLKRIASDIKDLFPGGKSLEEKLLDPARAAELQTINALQDSLDETISFLLGIVKNPGRLSTELTSMFDGLKKSIAGFRKSTEEANDSVESFKRNAGQQERVKSAFASIGKLVKGIGQGLRDVRDRFADTFNLGRQLATSAATAITDSMADAFESLILGTQSASQAFREFGRQVLQILAKVIAKIIATRIALAFLGIGGGGPGGGDGEGAPTGRNSTGIPQTPGAYNPNSLGGLGPNSLGGGGGGININFNIQTIDSTTFRGWLAKDRETVIGIVKNAMTRQTSTRRAFGR